jgi:hypothetical protein
MNGLTLEQSLINQLVSFFFVLFYKTHFEDPQSFTIMNLPFHYVYLDAITDDFDTILFDIKRAMDQLIFNFTNSSILTYDSISVSIYEFAKSRWYAATVINFIQPLKLTEAMFDFLSGLLSSQNLIRIASPINDTGKQ